MDKFIKRSALFLTFSIAACIGLFAAPVASRSAHGRVTELNGVPYYVGDVAVSQMLDLPASILSEVDQGDVDVFPLTIISSKASILNGMELNKMISDFVSGDDVFSPAFLQGQSPRFQQRIGTDTPPVTYISYEGKKHNPSIEKHSIYLELEGKKDANIVVSPEYSHGGGAAIARLIKNLPKGPYFVSTKTGKIFKAYRLYEDSNLAFLEPAISDEDGRFLRLMATSEVILMKIKAGPHKVGVAFVQRSFAQSDSPLQPIAMLPEMERVPTIPGVDISGPVQRHRRERDREPQAHLRLPPRVSRAEEPPCARRILANLAQRGVPPAGDGRGPQGAARRSTRWAAKAGDFEAGIESGLTRSCRARSSCSAPSPRSPNVQRRHSSTRARRIWSSPRASRSSCGARGPTSSCIELATAGTLQRPEGARRAGASHARGSALGIAGHELRVPVAERRPHRQHPAGPGAVSGFRSATCATGFREEIRLFLDSVLRDEPQRARPAALGRRRS